LSAFCIAALVALALEATVFNLPHYLKYIAGPQTSIISTSEADSDIILTTDGTRAEAIREVSSNWTRNGIRDGIRFKKLNRRVTAISKR